MLFLKESMQLTNQETNAQCHQTGVGSSDALAGQALAGQAAPQGHGAMTSPKAD